MKYSEDDYKNECSRLNLEYVGFHKEPRHIYVDFICPVHKEKGQQKATFSHLKSYSIGCKYCSGRGKTTEDIQKELGDDIHLLTEYIGCEKPIKCQCNICGNIWTTIPKVLTSNKSGCPQCGKRNAAEKRRKTKEEFRRELFRINPDFEVVGDYKGTHKRIEIKCKICGNMWSTYPANLLNRSAGCPKCNSSSGEKELLDVLSDLNINAIPQYPIRVEGYKKDFRFDAYDKENKVAFEFMGQQHYFPVDFAGKGEGWAKEQFSITQQRDYDKKKYCEDNGITMIIIPYTDKNNIKLSIINKYKEVNLTL